MCSEVGRGKRGLRQFGGQHATGLLRRCVAEAACFPRNLLRGCARAYCSRVRKCHLLVAPPCMPCRKERRDTIINSKCRCLSTLCTPLRPPPYVKIASFIGPMSQFVMYVHSSHPNCSLFFWCKKIEVKRTRYFFRGQLIKIERLPTAVEL